LAIPVDARTDPIAHLYSARRLARRRLLGHLVRARDHERRRIASAIHDASLQSLAAAVARLARARVGIDDPQVRYELTQAETILQQVSEELRELTFDLAMGTGEADGLAAEIRSLLQRLSDQTGAEVGLSERVMTEPPLETACTAYRIVQEALTNVQRHARASRVDVALDADTELYVRIEDNGLGFDPPGTFPSPGHMGMAMMRQRAEAEGGWIQIQSSPGGGTVVELAIPMDS